MKIDRGKIKKTPYELPFGSKVLIGKLMSCSDDNQLTALLTSIVTWEYEAIDLYHWADVLDKFDTVLEECCTRDGPNLWSTLAVDLPSNSKKKDLVMSILSFLSLLAECTYSGSIFNSTEHLTTLLWSADLKLVSQALYTMYIFGDQSSFFQSPGGDKWLSLRKHVLTVAKSWGGKEADVALVECMKDDVPLPILTASLNFECFAVGKDDLLKQPIRIRLDKAQLVSKQIGTIMTELIDAHHVPSEYQFELFNKIRLIQCFARYDTRLEYVRARVYALAFVACWRDDIDTSAFYSALVKELVDTLSVTHLHKYDLTRIQLPVVNALSALMVFEDGSREKAIIKATSIDSPTGPLSILVRKTIHELTANSDKDPTFFHESLLNLLLDISYSNTGQIVITQSGLLDSLLQLVKWEGPTVKHLRTVRYAMSVISKWTNLDPNSMRTSNGLNIIAKRLESELDNCRSMLPDGITDPPSKQYHSFSRLYTMYWALYILSSCIKQPSFTDLLRRLMSGSSLPQTLENIIRYGHFYGGTLFSEALEFITDYIQQNPFNLASIQDYGFSDLILNVLLKMNFPISKNVVTTIPGVFGALCINRRGMDSFLAMKPFERTFTLFTSVNFIREFRKQHNESALETADRFGTAMALLIRDHSNFRPMAVKAMIGLLNEVCRLGTEPKYICSGKFDLTGDEPDDFEDHQTLTQPWIDANNKEVLMTALATLNGEYRVNLTERRIRIPLHEYIKNSTKFINTFLRSVPAESSKEFLRSGGLDSLLNVLNLPNASPTEHLETTYSSVITIYDNVQQLTAENSVLRDCLVKFDSHLAHFNELMNQMNCCSTGSALFEDLCLCINSDQDFYQAPFLVTPTVQALSGLLKYLLVLNNSFVNGSADMLLKTIIIRKCISPLGLSVIDRLFKCYRTLIWERLILNKVLTELTTEQSSNDQSITKAQFVLDALSSRPPSPPFDVKVFVRQHTHKIINLIDQIDLQFKDLLSHFVQFSLRPLSDTILQATAPTELASALMKLIKSAFHWQTSMNDVDMRLETFLSKFCVSFIKIILILFDKTKEKSCRNLYYRDQSVQDAFFELAEQMTSDIDSYEKSGRKLSNDTMNLLDSWLELLELQTNEFTVDHSLLKFLSVGSQAITDPTEYISLTLKKVLNCLTKLWNVEMPRQFRNETFSRLLNVISNVFKSSGYVAKKVQVRCFLFDLDMLAMNIQNAALCLLEQSPSMVCELARLLCTIAQHNAPLGIGGFIRALIDVVTKNATSIVNLAQVVLSDDKEKIKLWASNPETTKLASQVHLLAVLSAEMPFACAKEMRSVKKCHLMPKLYSLLELTVQLVSMAGDSMTSMPQWLCPLILLIEQNEKNAIAYSQRQQVMKQCSKQTWKLYNGYKTIPLRFDGDEYNQFVKAYQDGHPYYRYKLKSIDKHYFYMHYLLHFGSMNLYCEETGQVEPIFIEMNAKQSNSQVSQLTQCTEQPSRAKSTIETMVTLLKLASIDASTVEAAIRTCLRLTRNHSNACHFAQLGGITALLNLTVNMQFDGLVPMTTLLIRHVYENEHVLRCSMNNQVLAFFRQFGYRKSPFSFFFQFAHSIACRDQTLTAEWIKSLVNWQGMICFCSQCVVVRRQLKPEEQSGQSKELTKEMLNVLADRWANEQDTTRPRMDFVFTSTKLLAILAEMSYLCKPNYEVILEHKYKQGRTEQITKDCGALDFILDNMLRASNSKNVSSFTENVLIRLMRTSEQTFRNVFGDIDAALSRALACADSAEKHRKIESICSLIEQTEHFAKWFPSLAAELFKMIEQSGLISKLASATDSLDLSSAYISTSVNASLNTIDRLIGFINKMKSTNSAMANKSNGSNDNSQQPVQEPQLATSSDLIPNLYSLSPANLRQTLTDISNRQKQASSTEFRFECSGKSANTLKDWLIDEDDEARSCDCNESTFCPLMHPYLLAGKCSPVSNPVNVVLHYQDCRRCRGPLTAYENKFALKKDQITGSYSFGNSVAIFHSLNCMCPVAKQVAPCSMCQWFLECCLVDGQFQFDSIDLVKAQLLPHRQKIIEQTVKELEKALLSSSKETSNASPNDPEAKANKTNDVVSSAVPIQSEQTKESKLNEAEQQSELSEAQSSNDQDISEMTKVPTNKQVVSKVPSEPEQQQQENAKQQIVEISEKSVVNVSGKFDTTKEDLSTPKQTTLEQAKVDVVVKVTETIPKEVISLTSLQLALKSIDTALAPNDDEQIDTVILDFAGKLNTLKENVKESQPIEPVPLEQSKDSPPKESPITNLDLTAEQRAILGDEPIPEGLDPAVLVELPDDLRMEAIEQQRQINSHKQQQAQMKQQDATVGAATGSNVTPQVASSIIPAVGQGQQEQQQQPPTNGATNPAAQIVSFIQSLEPMVRQQVLAEMDDSQLRYLPAEMVTEVRVLRQEAARRLQELENAANTNATTAAITAATTNQQVNSPTRDYADDDDDSPPEPSPTEPNSNMPSVPMNGPQLIETKHLSSLLLLLFVKNDSIDRARFHSVVASFCSHQPTRKWMVYSLLDTLEKANPLTNPLLKDPAALDHATQSTPGSTSWKSVTIESTFGARLKVLSYDSTTNSLLILPQAANSVYGNVLDLFLFLSKTFPDFCLETSEPNSSEQKPST